MLSGEITACQGDTYSLTLNDGQALRVSAASLPASLQAVGQKVNLLFGGVESSGAEPGDARALLNSLLTLG